MCQFISSLAGGLDLDSEFKYCPVFRLPLAGVTIGRSRGRERMEAEYGFYDALQTRGLVRVHSSPPNRGTRLPDSRRQCLTDQGLAECTAP